MRWSEAASGSSGALSVLFQGAMVGIRGIWKIKRGALQWLGPELSRSGRSRRKSRNSKSRSSSNGFLVKHGGKYGGGWGRSREPQGKSEGSCPDSLTGLSRDLPQGLPRLPKVPQASAEFPSLRFSNIPQAPETLLKLRSSP